MKSRDMPRARVRLFAAIAVTGSLVIGYALMEAAYRAYLYVLYAAERNFAVTTVDVRSFTTMGAPGSLYGFYQPNKPITFSSFDAGGRLLQRHTTPINNYGWPSAHDYSRARAPGEFRIAILGDSMTASINNARPWPDVVQRHLDADAQLKSLLGASKITVLNLGVAGASLQFMVVPLSVIAKRFAADMVIVNFIGDDLRRRHGDVFTRATPAPDIHPEPAVPKDEPPTAPPPDVFLDGVGIDVLCLPPRDLARPECGVSPYFFVPPGVQLDGDGVNKVKRKLGAQVYWSRVFPSLKPLLLLDVLGRPAVRVPPRPSFRAWFRPEAVVSQVLHMKDTIEPEEKRLEDLEIGVGSIKYIKSMHPDMMVTHNPLYWYLDGQMREKAVDDLAAALAPDGIEVTRVAKYLPAGKTKDDWLQWYNLPHDGHWSDLGAEVYGEAMSKAVRERLFATRAKPAGTATAEERPRQSAN